MANRRLKLKKYELQNINYFWLGAFRLRVEVSDPCDAGTDPHVFLFQRKPPNPYNDVVEDEWLGIASPVDMSEFPVGEPNETTAYPFFRLNYLEVDLRSVDVAHTVWKLIQEEVAVLIQALDRMELLVPTEEVYVGAAACESTGGSESSSSSASLSSSGSTSV